MSILKVNKLQESEFKFVLFITYMITYYYFVSYILLFHKYSYTGSIIIITHEEGSNGFYNTIFL